jgi:hypothetical protein
MLSNVWLKMVSSFISSSQSVFYFRIFSLQRWLDIYLAWNPDDFGGIKEVRMPIKYIWKPDVLLYNSVDQQFDSMWPINAVVYRSVVIDFVSCFSSLRGPLCASESTKQR